MLLWTPGIIGWQFVTGNRTVPDNDCYVQFITDSNFMNIFTSLVAFYIPVTIMCMLYFEVPVIVDESLL